MKQNQENSKTTGDKSCEQPRKQWRLDLILMFCSVVIGLLLISLAFVSRQRCDSNSSLTLNLSKLNNDLDTNIIGQKLSMDMLKGQLQFICKFELIQTFAIPDIMQDFIIDDQSPNLAISVLLLIGGAGTGKSLTAEMIQDSFPVKVG